MKNEKQNILARVRAKHFERLNYAPHSGQRLAHDCGARFVVSVCGRRWGKSLMAGREAEARAIIPNQRIWLVAPNYNLADKTFRVIWHDFVLRGKVKVKRKSESQRFIQTAGNSVIECKSAENPDSLVGEGLDFIVLDEAAKMGRDIWEKYLRPALADRRGDAMFISTPEGRNWIYELWLRGRNEEFPEWFSLQSPSWNNPVLEAGEIESARKTLAHRTFLQEFGAEFVSVSNAVYPEFSRATHVIPYEFRPEYETYCALDFGWQNPTAVLWIQVDPARGIAYVFDELVEPHLTTEQLARIIQARGYPVRHYYCDPSGNSTLPGGDNAVANLRKFGINCEFRTDRLSRSVNAGIELLRGKLRNSLGEVSLYFSDKLSRVTEDIAAYRYPEMREGEPAPEEPLKDGVTDHSMDALRYFAVNRFPLEDDAYRSFQW